MAEGKIVETVEPNTDGAIMRTTKTGREVWERRDGYVDGIITSMFHREREVNGEKMESLVIRLRDKDEHYALEVNKGSRYWVSIMMRLPNVNASQPVRFMPYDFEAKGEDGTMRRMIGSNLYQNGRKIDPAWSKSSPGDLPQGQKVRVNGKDVWDFEARDKYLLRVFAELVDQLQTGDMAMGGVNDEHPPAPTVDDMPPAALEPDDLPW